MNYSKLFLQTIIRETIEIICHKLLPEKSLQTILKNFYQGIILNNIHTYLLLSKKPFEKKLYKLLQEKSLQTVLTNYYQRNHYKLCLKKFIREFNSF